MYNVMALVYFSQLLNTFETNRNNSFPKLRFKAEKVANFTMRAANQVYRKGGIHDNESASKKQHNHQKF